VTYTGQSQLSQYVRTNNTDSTPGSSAPASAYTANTLPSALGHFTILHLFSMLTSELHSENSTPKTDLYRELGPKIVYPLFRRF
jgi:hypothetical protein